MLKKIKRLLLTINKWFFMLLLMPAIIYLGIFMLLFCKVETIDKMNDFMNELEDLLREAFKKTNPQ